MEELRSICQEWRKVSRKVDVDKVKECEGRNTCLGWITNFGSWPENGTDGVLGGVVFVDLFQGQWEVQKWGGGER